MATHLKLLLGLMLMGCHAQPGPLVGSDYPVPQGSAGSCDGAAAGVTCGTYPTGLQSILPSASAVPYKPDAATPRSDATNVQVALDELKGPQPSGFQGATQAGLWGAQPVVRAFIGDAGADANVSCKWTIPTVGETCIIGGWAMGKCLSDAGGKCRPGQYSGVRLFECSGVQRSATGIQPPGPSGPQPHADGGPNLCPLPYQMWGGPDAGLNKVSCGATTVDATVQIGCNTGPGGPVVYECEIEGWCL